MPGPHPGLQNTPAVSSDLADTGTGTGTGKVARVRCGHSSAWRCPACRVVRAGGGFRVWVVGLDAFWMDGVTVTVRRRCVGVVSGVVVAVSLVSGCSGLGRSTVGMLSFRGEDERVEVSYSNTLVKGCHKIGVPGGATHVANNTLVDVVLYRTADCREVAGGKGIYTATTLSNVTAPNSLPWRSFSVIH